MAEEQQTSYENNIFEEIVVRIRDQEERQRIMKERLLIVGKNLIEIREQLSQETIEVKKDMQNIQQELKQIKNILKNFGEEISNCAKKNELEILVKQAKMFQPLDMVTKSELKEFVKSAKKID